MLIYIFWIYRVITTVETNSHEAASIALSKPVQETLQLGLGQDDIEALQRRYKFRKILPECLNTINSKMFLQKRISKGTIYMPRLIVSMINRSLHHILFQSLNSQYFQNPFSYRWKWSTFKYGKRMVRSCRSGAWSRF